MELRAFLSIFIQHSTLLLSVICASVAIGLVCYFAQSESYSTSLTLNVARTSGAEATDENYSGFYRLQADERFGDTIVRWLQSPRIVEEILESSGAQGQKSEKELRSIFRGVRLSSQVVEVQFISDSSNEATARAESIITVLNDITGELNSGDDSTTWFRILGEKPVIRPYEKSAHFLVTLSAVIGIFLGLFSVLFWYYWKES